MKLKEILKKAAIPLLLGIVTLLAFKFIIWNTWKVDRAFKMAERVIKARPAVNLTLSNEAGNLFRKGFAYNPKGNYYLIRNFDITPYIKAASRPSLALDVTVNGRLYPLSTHLFRFKTFNVVDVNQDYFIFAKARSTIQDFIKIMDLAPKLVNTLYFPDFEDKTGNKNELAVDCSLSHGSGRFTIPLPMTFRKGNYYQLHFQYRCTGADDVKPIIMLAKPPYETGHIVFRYPLETGVTSSRKKTYRNGMILFSPEKSYDSLQLHFMVRSIHRGKRFKGTVHFKNAVLFQHTTNQPRSGHSSLTRLTYQQHLDEVNRHRLSINNQ